jgi:hypothetical protein
VIGRRLLLLPAAPLFAERRGNVHYPAGSGKQGRPARFPKPGKSLITKNVGAQGEKNGKNTAR